MWRQLASLLLALAGTPALAAISVLDDSGNKVTLAQPAQRIISMSPHVTELLFAAGGGARVVGVMNYSDYPEAARQIAQVGSNASLDMERLAALKPDLLVVWQSGNTARQLEQLRQLGIPMFYSEPQQMEQIASSVERLGQLMGTEAVARPAAGVFRAKVAALAARYGKRPPVRMFYQIWDKPLYTLNGKQIVSDAVRLCGGENVFASLPVKAPEVSVEAVIGADPEAIFGGAGDELAGSGLQIWKPYKSMLAVRRGNLFSLSGGLLARAGPRMVDGAAELCEKLELARQRRP
ncbi:cobalamin-binding protein [Massilia sp. CF038]|uniref:cobalamin-binding protein n=1 Tax=Massilia sp. CF038 TaxID=1881045 RepID=UPI000914EE35|nr:cobalamin-binding protein [Massilia sp. CF038]SHH15367.1 iron complex transport system substrate-binding protein [Massilia sp. CF038]